MESVIHKTFNFQNVDSLHFKNVIVNFTKTLNTSVLIKDQDKFLLNVLFERDTRYLKLDKLVTRLSSIR